MLDVRTRLVVIVGGGAVAVRKAKGVLEAGAGRVRMVSPAFRPDVPESVERVTSRYEPSHLDGAGLVFASTDRAEVNDAVLRDARARGILACRADADDDDPGDFVTPAKLVRGPVVVTISAGSAALAARVRDGVAERFDPAWAAMAEAMVLLRPRVRSAALPQARRADVFRELASDEAMTRLAAGGPDGLWAWLGSRYPELLDG